MLHCLFSTPNLSITKLFFSFYFAFHSLFGSKLNQYCSLLFSGYLCCCQWNFISVCYIVVFELAFVGSMVLSTKDFYGVEFGFPFWVWKVCSEWTLLFTCYWGFIVIKFSCSQWDSFAFNDLILWIERNRVSFGFYPSYYIAKRFTYIRQQLT